MHANPPAFESNYKRLGYSTLSQSDLNRVNSEPFRSSIEILLLPVGYRLTADFTLFETAVPALFFVTHNPFLTLQPGSLSVVKSGEMAVFLTTA